MPSLNPAAAALPHDHNFLGEDHAHAERRSWAVIWLCTAMMLAEIAGGLLFGSIALVADGLHMSTHAGALLLAALAYRYARRHANDDRFTFGTGKLGDLAGFTSAIVLAMIAALIGWEAVSRLLAPVPIQFAQAIPIAALGLAVNIASAWLLSGGHAHGHSHGHSHGHGGGHDHEAEMLRVEFDGRMMLLGIEEDGVPPRFRLQDEQGAPLQAGDFSIETIRPDGARQLFRFVARSEHLESIEEIPEPHEFTALLRNGTATASVRFDEHDHADGAAAHRDNHASAAHRDNHTSAAHRDNHTSAAHRDNHANAAHRDNHASAAHRDNHANAAHRDNHASAAHRDNNMRAAIMHVVADAAVSVLVIVGLLLARAFGWLWMDPLAGLVGAGVIASWAYGLVRDTGAILLDMNPDRRLAERLRQEIETDGDHLTDLHLWRLGPGHLGAELCVVTSKDRGPADYRDRLRRFRGLSHMTIEVQNSAV